MFDVTIDPSRQLLRIRVVGFWTLEVMRSYVAELSRKAAALDHSGGCRRILVDMSDYPIQSQAVAQGHARIIAHGRNEMRAATAVVMQSALSKLQAKRIAGLAGRELFDDETAALDWLVAQPVR